MVLRWVAAGMGEAATQFRRVNGYLHLAALRVALDQTIAAVTPTKEDAAYQPLTAAEVPRRSGQPRGTTSVGGPART